MPHITTDISPHGPLISILVGVSSAHANFLRSRQLQVPIPVGLQALIDTGASVTCLDSAAVSPLRLRVTGNVPITTPSTGSSPHICDECDVSIVLAHPDHNVELATVPIITTDLSSLAR